jgi:hypothetical protein
MDVGVSLTAAHPHPLREGGGALAVRAPRVPGSRRPLALNEVGAFDVQDLETNRAHPARIDDYLVGGHDNYEVDRDLAD